jgi:hypothetical protein
MACGGCGQRREQQGASVVPRGSTIAVGMPVISVGIAARCPKCGWPMRRVHKFDREKRQAVASLVCINNHCRFSQ